MKYKKLMVVILSVVILFGALPFTTFTASAATSGTTGDCTWSLDGSVLTISGDGVMEDYSYEYAGIDNPGPTTAPWGTSITNVIIEDGVTSIGNYTFSSCDSLVKIIIPDSVIRIGEGAFWGCGSLKKICITDIMAWSHISFSNYTSNPMINAGNLYLNNELVTEIIIPDGTTNISDYVYMGIRDTSVTIPDGVTNIGNGAFWGCSSLINISIPDSIISIGLSAFRECNSLTSINIPRGVISIGACAFAACTSLSSIKIPDSVTEIGRQVFGGCNSLNEITIGNGLTEIDNWAFENLTSLVNVTIGNDVTSIGIEAFKGCYSLTNISIGERVTSIAYDAFEYCSSLKNVYITDIKKWCNISFSDITSNPTIQIPSTPMYYADNLYLNNQLLNHLKIPNDTEIINKYTFYNCKSIESVFIPKSLILIKQDAFYNCRGIKNVYFEGTAEEWNNITILSGNDYLQNATVYYNSNDIPSGITSIEISKSPDKVQYIENEEELDLTGGVLTVNYDGGAKQEIDLTTLNVEGFDNSILGKQTITVKYGDFSTEFEIEIISRPISFIAISTFPNTREYILGNSLDLTGGKIAVGYPKGNYEIFDLTENMILNYDMNQSGYQILTVTYKGHITEFSIRIFKNGDIDGDDTINATDVTLLIKNLLNDYETTTKYDINQDNSFDVRDLVRLKKKLAEINGTLDSDNTETPSINPKTELKLNTAYYHVRNEYDCSYLTEFQFDGSQLICNALYGTDKEFAEIDTPVIYKGIEYYQYGFGGPLPKYTLTDEEIILEYGDEFLGYPEFEEKYILIITPNLDLYVTYSTGWLFNVGDILELNYTK